MPFVTRLVFDLCSLIVESVFDCHLSGVCMIERLYDRIVDSHDMTKCLLNWHNKTQTSMLQGYKEGRQEVFRLLDSSHEDAYGM